jgi:hypothetical protein
LGRDPHFHAAIKAEARLRAPAIDPHLPGAQRFL